MGGDNNLGFNLLQVLDSWRLYLAAKASARSLHLDASRRLPHLNAELHRLFEEKGVKIFSRKCSSPQATWVPWTGQGRARDFVAHEDGCFSHRRARHVGKCIRNPQ